MKYLILLLLLTSINTYSKESSTKYNKEALEAPKVALEHLPYIKYKNEENISNFSSINTDKAKWFFSDKIIAIPVSSNLSEKLILKTKSLTDKSLLATQFLNIDANKVEALSIDIKNNANNPCYLQIQLFDDDNKNEVIEVYKEYPSIISQDDKFIYTISLKPDEEKTFQIPINYFYDDNPNHGDNLWNPNQINGSGGLIQMQLLFFLLNKQKKDHKIDVIISKISFLSNKERIYNTGRR